MSSLQARRGEVKMDMAPIGMSTPPSQWLQSGKVRTYQDIIRGRLRGEQESEREVLPWSRGSTELRRRAEREKARFSMLEGEDTWSGSSDWVENRLGQEDWTNARLGQEAWTSARLHGHEEWKMQEQHLSQVVLQSQNSGTSFHHYPIRLEQNIIRKVFFNQQKVIFLFEDYFI